ncbi:MAG: bifunctional hydroxymethylpyrimidine kinase/phosphomethylpyrimidine kinase [Lachnospiraceae bacterium]|nr:bifunctional hydroxymethylpyrimidine kinase/phosphomethylpyrimidine kinase [Lachnospiraceae bacterium]
MTLEEADILIEKLLSIGAKSIVVTSAVVDHREAVIIYDYEKKERSILPFTSIPVRFPGTGDIFSAVFMGKVLEGRDIVESTDKAMKVTKTMIERNQDNADKFKGIPIESCLEVLD